MDSQAEPHSFIRSSMHSSETEVPRPPGSLLKAKDAGWVPPQTMGSGLIQVSTDNVGLPVDLDAPRRRELPN